MIGFVQDIKDLAVKNSEVRRLVTRQSTASSCDASGNLLALRERQCQPRR
jgi:hypothetical protein